MVASMSPILRIGKNSMVDNQTADTRAILKALANWDKKKGSGTSQFCLAMADRWGRLAEEAISEEDQIKFHNLAVQWREAAGSA